MRALRLSCQAVTVAVAGTTCTGCHMLGALFDERTLGGVIAIVVVVAIAAFLFSKSRR